MNVKMSISIHPSVDLLQSTDNVRHIYVFYCLRFVLIHLANVLHVSSHVSMPKNRKKSQKIGHNKDKHANTDPKIFLLYDPDPE